MGNCIFSAKFEFNDEIPGQDHVCAKVFKELMLSENEINKFYTAFKDIDADNSNYIREDELMAYFRIERSVLNKKIFRLYGETGYLDFLQFVCSMWNFLSMDPSDLGTFVFCAFCDRSSMLLTADQFEAMMTTIHGLNYASNKALGWVAKKKVAELRDYRSVMTLQEFTVFCRANRMLVDPVAMLQFSLRSALIGDSFWKELAIRRYEETTVGNASDVLAVSREAMMSTERLLSRKKKPGANAPQSGSAVLLSHMKKVVPTEVLQETQESDLSDLKLPQKPRRRRSLLRPKLNGIIGETLNIVSMINGVEKDMKETPDDVKALMNKADSCSRIMYLEACTVAAEKGGRGNSTSSPRERGSNPVSPRSRKSSSRASSSRSRRNLQFDDEIDALVSEPKSRKKRNGSEEGPMVTVTKANSCSRLLNDESGGGGSNTSTPRGRGSNPGSPRSRTNSPRGNSSASPRSPRNRSPAGSPRSSTGSPRTATGSPRSGAGPRGNEHAW